MIDSRFTMQCKTPDRKYGVFVLICCTVLLLYTVSVLESAQAVPQGPSTINISSSERNPLSQNPVEVQAEAGNVTAMVIDGTRITKAWQGYYGNITGNIVLDDANNFSMYRWSLTAPSGEIYAANSSGVDWTVIHCLNVSQTGSTPVRPDGTVTRYNTTTIELAFGINLTDSDGVDETFTGFYNDSDGFNIGAIPFDGTDGCSMLHPYVNNSPSDVWQELLLSDNESIVFATVIQDDQYNFQDSGDNTADFQMMVLENGHFGSESTTTSYYFYVELT